MISGLVNAVNDLADAVFGAGAMTAANRVVPDAGQTPALQGGRRKHRKKKKSRKKKKGGYKFTRAANSRRSMRMKTRKRRSRKRRRKQRKGRRRGTNRKARRR